MQITALNDFYVEYEINAYTSDAARLPAVYSELHANILRRFFEEGVEIMSPHIFAHRQDLDVQMPSEYRK
jgi:small-conductance mechanosensitive channel